MACINIKSKSFIDLMEATKLPSFLLEAKISKFQRDNVTDEFPSAKDLVSDSEVNQSLKAVEILNSDKAKQIFEKGNKANWDLNKILTELQVPKDQKALLLDLNITDREELALQLASNYSYSVKIDITKNIEGRGMFSDIENYGFIPGTDEEAISYVVYDYDGNLIKQFDSQKEADDYIEKNGPKLKNSSYYLNLTVTGGTNYTENEISTPLITPSIKGHAQFSTDNGVGWFRSDEKNSENDNQKEIEADIQLQKDIEEGFAEPGMRSLFLNNGEGTKTRRILEVQSDLFQKGRDKKDLTRKT